jgi:hypothetical protein
MAELEALDLGLDADGLDALRHLAQEVAGGHEQAVAEVEGAAVERADLRSQFLDMGDALGRIGHVGAAATLGGVFWVKEEVAAHAGGEVDDDIDAAVTDALHGFAVVLELAAGLAGLGVAHMKMRDGGARLGRLDRRLGDLFRRHRNGRVLADRVAGAGHGAADDDVLVHGSGFPRIRATPVVPARPSWGSGPPRT